MSQQQQPPRPPQQFGQSRVPWYIRHKILTGLGAFVAFLFVVGIVGSIVGPQDTPVTARAVTTTGATTDAKVTRPAEVVKTTVASTPKPKATKRATSGQRNALAKARDYLSISAFSRKGLIKQLKFEQYSTSEATYAVNHVGADWSEQAVAKAKEYLAVQSFSRPGLVTQLEYEGFTAKQAKHGVAVAY